MPLPDESQLLDDIAHARGEAKSLKSLYALYALKGAQRVALSRMVSRLVQQGRLVRLRGGSRFGIPKGSPVIEGILQGTARGFAFVSPEDSRQPDVFIREADLAGALHGDRVEVAIKPDSDPERPAGAVVAILEHGDDHVVGLVRRDDGGRRVTWRLHPFNPKISVPITIPERFLSGASEDTWVEARLLREARKPGRASDGDALEARVVAVLGTDDEPGTDVRVVLRAHGLQDAHSPEAVAEAEHRAEATMTPAELARRTDFRSLPTVTIDGETARDFDDAISIERRDGGYRLWVHIADVSAHVVEGTRLDDEAYQRGTSVYFPDRAVHMLPEALAARACSLVPGQDRLTMTAILDHDASGAVMATSFCESVIRSDRRMTYTEIKRILVDRDEELRRRHAELLPMFELMGELASRLIARREDRGGLDFDLPEPLIRVDADGLVTEIVPSERNVAHRIIEEFMIGANEAVARYLQDEGEPAIYRNHEPPPPDKIEAFRQAAQVFGHDVRAKDGAVSPKDIQAVVKKASGRPEEAFLTTLALRTMSLARYEAEERGHFGLALEHYCHFTSPIRRYPDLVVHRALRRRLQQGRMSPEDAKVVVADLAETADHCSATERNAEAAERAIVQWKKVAFLRDKIGEEFEGRITGIAERGVFVLISEHHVDGFVPFPALKRDWYDRDERGFMLVGRDTRRVLRLGDRLDVVVSEVDMLLRRVTFAESGR